MKKYISLMLAFVLCLNILIGIPTKSYAISDLNSINNTRNTEILEITGDKIIYSYEHNGEKYKNIDSISSEQSAVNSEVYLLKDNSYVLEDVIDTKIKDGIISIYSSKENSYDDIYVDSLMSPSRVYKWKFNGSYFGNTYLKNLGLGAIATAIAIAVSNSAKITLGWKLFTGVSAYAFDKSLIKTYYKVDQFIDNTSQPRPSFQNYMLFYTDSAHKNYIPNSLVVNIFNPNR